MATVRIVDTDTNATRQTFDSSALQKTEQDTITMAHKTMNQWLENAPQYGINLHVVVDPNPY